MLAARLHAAGEPLTLEEVPLPEPVGTGVRIRVAGCGVCRTDLHIADGSMRRVELPRTLGHEVAGWVSSVGPAAEAPLRAAGLQPGDPVLVFGGWGCGGCRECRRGAEQRCDRSRAPGFQLDGGYAEAMLVPHPRHLVALRDLDPVRAAPLADAAVTTYRTVRRVEPWLGPGARVLVIGAGGLGRFLLQHLRLLPAAGPELVVTVADVRDGALDAAAALGADAGVLLSGQNGGGRPGGADLGRVREALAGEPVDVALDLVGTDATLALAAEVVAPGGLVAIVGEAGGRLPVSFERPAVEAWVTTIAWGSLDDLRDVVKLAEAGRLTWEVEPIPLHEAPAALDRLRRGAVDDRLVLVPPG